MACITYKFYYPFVGVAQRALLNRMETCAIFFVSHVSPKILYLVERLAAKRNARYVVVYTVLTGSLNYKPIYGLYINANHHEKYYLVDGIMLATGSANLTESEFDDKTLNDLTIHVCSEPRELENIDDYKVMAEMLNEALESAGINVEHVARFLSDTPCAHVFQKTTNNRKP